MKEDYNENDPERIIFRGALNSLEIEPSEKFWNNALHGIIDKERVAGKKRVRTWKGISFSLAAIILLFCLHEAWMYNSMNGIEKQISDLKRVQNKLVKKENDRQSVTNNNAGNQTGGNTASSPVNKNTTAGALNHAQNLSAIVATNAPRRHPAVTRGYIRNNRNSYMAHSSAKKLSSAKVSRNAELENTTTSSAVAAANANRGTEKNVKNESGSPVAAGNNPPATAQNAGAAGSLPATPGENSLATAQVKSNSVNKSVTSTNPRNDSLHSSQVTKVDSAALTAKADSVNSLPANVLPAPKISFIHRLYASGFFAPGTGSDFLKDKEGNDNDYDDDNVTKDEVKTRQSNRFSYETGLKLGYDISKKFTLHTGIYYDMYSYDIKETVLTAQKLDNGQVGCSLVTSSGVVYVPYNGSWLNQGDSLKVRGSSARGYICIPLQLSYIFATHYKIGYYADAGFATDIAAYSSTTLHWENTKLQEGNASVSSVEGLIGMHYTYSFGVGVDYKLGKGFVLYGEPFIRGSLTSINRNTPIVTYPYFFGCEFGLTYHL